MANTPLTYNDIADVLRKTTLGYILQTNRKKQNMTVCSDDNEFEEDTFCDVCERKITDDNDQCDCSSLDRGAKRAAKLLTNAIDEEVLRLTAIKLGATHEE